MANYSDNYFIFHKKLNTQISGSTLFGYWVELHSESDHNNGYLFFTQTASFTLSAPITGTATVNWG